MTAQFTPGPWEVVGQDDHSDVDRADDCVMITGQADAQGLVEVALVYTIDSFDPDGWSVEDRPATAAEYEANARLIAAAPDLYAAAKAFIVADDEQAALSTMDVHQMFNALRAAVEKAESTTTRRDSGAPTEEARDDR
jgi:hypothetical protein